MITSEKYMYVGFMRLNQGKITYSKIWKPRLPSTSYLRPHLSELMPIKPKPV